jgi:tetratricopeptide (TPR) repeat protein
LQEEYGERVKFIGVTREDEGTVAGFLEQDQSLDTTWNEVIKYRIALDADDQTNQSYMAAAQQRGIPAAFVVGKDGFIEWIGHPATIDEPLAKIVADSWDREAAAAEFRQQAETQNMLMALQRDLTRAMQSSDYDKAVEILDGATEKIPSMTTQFLMLKSRILRQAGRAAEAAAIQPQLIEKLWDEPMGLNQIAWEITSADEPGDLDVALKAATRAAELTDNQDPSILDTLARVYHEKGDLKQAIALQKKAVELEPGADEIRETLEAYEAELNGSAEESDADPIDEVVEEEANVEPEK